MTPEQQLAFESLLAEYQGLAIQCEEVTDRMNAIKAAFRALGTEGSPYVVGKYKVTVIPTRRFSQDLAEQLLTPEQKEQVTVPTYSAKLVLDLLGRKVLTLCQADAGLDTVRIGTA